MYVLGIDGGGTKTKGVISSVRGEIVAEAVVGPSNPNSVTEADLKVEIAKLISSLVSQFNGNLAEVKQVFAGMSGVDNPKGKVYMSNLIAGVLPEGIPVSVNNDAITALYSGTLGKPGIVQIAGTGSITYGLNVQGDTGRVGGWGYLLGERGSGFAIGSDGLRAALEAHDGLGEKSLLQELFLQHFEVQSLPEIIQPVYQAKNVKELIASMSRLVMKAADQGDQLAKQIIEQNARKMGESIACLVKQMFELDNVIPVVLVGGLFNRFDLLEAVLRETIEGHGLQVDLRLPKIEPVGGSVVAAWKEYGIPVGEEFLDNFSREQGKKGR